MPRTNLGKAVFSLRLTVGLAVVLACTAGCVPPPPSATARANLHQRNDDQDEYDFWLWRRATGQTNRTPDPSAAPAAQGYSPSAGLPGQGWTAAPPPYGPPATATTRYADPNVVPTGGGDMAPAAGIVSPYDVGNGPPGPPPGYAGPAVSSPITVSPISASRKKKTDDDGEWDLSQLAPDETWKKFKEAIGWGADERLAREAYDRGQGLFRDRKYEEAADEFYTAVWRWPDSMLEEDAMFLLAESYFFSDRYGKAQDSYSNLLKKHDNTRYLDTVVARLFAIGTYWEQLDLRSHQWPITPNVTDKTQPWFDTIGNALACYQSVWVHDPTGPLADAALMRVGNVHFRRSEWEEAADHYAMLRKNHPKSKYQKDAHVLELQAKMQIYQGPRYSVVPLNDAQEIAEQALKQFPGRLGPEERRVRQALSGMIEQRAEREWMMGQYYDDKREFRAAREYYKVLVAKYPRTSYGQRAAARLEEIRNEPDEPPNRFAWLTGLFGKGK